MPKKLLLSSLSAGVPALFGFYLYSPMLGAKLGLIDDHEFIRFLSVGSRDLTAIPAMLETSEVANFGETARFRPAYYSLRALGSVLHGTNGAQWYLFRVIFFLLLIVGLSLLIQKVASRAFKLSDTQATVLAAAAGLLIAGMAAWQDIVTRLGPSELYLSLGLLISGWGIWYLATKRLQFLGAVLISLGFSLAVGSKENTISLIAPLLLTMLLLWIAGSSKFALIAAGLVSISATAFTAAGFLPSVLSSGEDVYGASRSLSGALGAVFQLWPFWVALVVGLVGILLALRTELPKLHKGLLSLLAFSPLLVTVSEAFFYQYSIVAGAFGPARYGVVTELTGILSLAFLAMAIIRIGSHPRSKLLVPISIATAAGLLVPMGQLSNSFSYREFSEANASYLNAQFQSLAQTAELISASSIGQVLYIVDEPYDYERISASKQYIEYLSGAETKYFLYADFSKVQFDQFTLPLAESLQDWSGNGNADWEITALTSLNQEAATLCVHFGQTPDPSPCSESQWIGG